MTFAPLSDLTVRVVPTPNGRAEVQATSSRIRHHQRVVSAVNSAHTSPAGRATANVSLSFTGAESKNVSSIGSFLDQGRCKRATVPGLVHASRKIAILAGSGTLPEMEDFGFELVCAN